MRNDSIWQTFNVCEIQLLLSRIYNSSAPRELESACGLARARLRVASPAGLRISHSTAAVRRALASTQKQVPLAQSQIGAGSIPLFATMSFLRVQVFQGLPVDHSVSEEPT